MRQIRSPKSEIRNPKRLVFRIVAALLFFVVIGFCAGAGEAKSTIVLLVIGAPGEAEYGTNFLRQAELWQKACQQGGAKDLVIGLGDTNQTNDLAQLKQVLDDETKNGVAPLWLVMIGHGTFDGKEAKFNLRGPDLSATDLAAWLQPFTRPLAVIDTSSSSAPFLNKLSGTNRVIVTATRSGNEQNFARFAQYMAEAIGDPQSDLDKDGAVSLLEAFLMASRRAAEFYKSEERLITEHALIDDNGDGLGTQADWFRGLRAVKIAKEGALVDGLLAQQFYLVRPETDRNLTTEQIARRDSLERQVLLYREKKEKLPEDEYYREMEKLLVQLAKVYEATNNLSPR